MARDCALKAWCDPEPPEAQAFRADALLEASVAVNQAVTDEFAATALNQIWNLRRARSFATIALGIWAYGPGPSAPPTIKEDVIRLHLQGQRLSRELQALYHEAVNLACIQMAMQPE